MPSITISTSILRAAFPPLNKVIPRRASLPALGYLKIARVQNCMTFTATDLDCTLTFTHPLEPAPLTALGRTMAELRWKREGCEFLVLRDALQAALKAVRNGDMTISDEELRYEIAGAPMCVPFEPRSVSEYPETTAPPVVKATRLDREHRAWLVASLRFGSQDETRYVLNGVLCEATGGGAFVATDGRRLCRRMAPALVGLGADVIVPTAAVEVLGMQALLEQEWTLGISANSEIAVVQAGPWQLVTKLIEGNYPNYRQVIPDMAHFATARLTERTHRQLREVLANLPQGDPGRPSVWLRFYRDRLGLAAESPNVKVSVLGISCDAPLAAAFTREYLIDALSTGPGTFHIRDAMSPMVYEHGGALHVLMPRRTETGGSGIEDPELEATVERWVGKTAKFRVGVGDEPEEGEVKGIRREGVRLVAVMKCGSAEIAAPLDQLCAVSVKKTVAPAAQKKNRHRVAKGDLAAA